MQNITTEHYKKAIKEKYEEVKNGDNSHFLQNPSQAKLRKLCWEIFQINKNSDDLKSFSTLFEFCFDISKKNTLQSKTDKFKSVGAFFRGKTESPTDEIIEFAAVLVGFEPRPFGKFKKYYGQENSIQETENLRSLNSESNIEKEAIVNVENFNTENKIVESSEAVEPVNLFMDFEKELSEKGINKKRRNALIVIFCAFCLFFLGYYFIQKKQCMQWSVDHYEKVSCDLEVQEIGTYIPVEPLDERVIHLKKIRVSDTTTFFKNGEAIIWYAKVGDRIEFFTTHGRHPENNKPLKPVTQYIIDKYVK